MKVPSFETSKFLSMVKLHYSFLSVTNNADIFAIGYNAELDESLERPMSIEVYSDKNETWNHQYVISN